MDGGSLRLRHRGDCRPGPLLRLWGGAQAESHVIGGRQASAPVLTPILGFGDDAETNGYSLRNASGQQFSFLRTHVTNTLTLEKNSRYFWSGPAQRHRLTLSIDLVQKELTLSCDDQIIAWGAPTSMPTGPMAPYVRIDNSYSSVGASTLKITGFECGWDA
ncbi:MAG: hypothetical protein K0R62_8301 [Nonomuraea muscovyensis]|nr:hypothetical protein [Nonomuraea muscovyensis]